MCQDNAYMKYKFSLFVYFRTQSLTIMTACQVKQQHLSAVVYSALFEFQSNNWLAFYNYVDVLTIAAQESAQSIAQHLKGL